MREEARKVAIEFDGRMLCIDFSVAHPSQVNNCKPIRLAKMTKENVVRGSVAPCEHLDGNSVEKVPEW